MNLTLKSDTFSIDFNFPEQFVNSALLTFVQCQTVRHNEIDDLVIRAIRNPQTATKPQQTNPGGVHDASTDEPNKTPSAIKIAAKEALPAHDEATVESMEDYGFSKTRRPERNSSVARMFGDRHNISSPKTPADSYNLDGYRGFLIIKCRQCGDEHAFCTKTPMKSSTCSKCGATTTFNVMRPAFTHCECGKDFRYMTNIEDKNFTYTCFQCGSPVEMELNGKGNAFVTINRRDEA